MTEIETLFMTKTAEKPYLKAFESLFAQIKKYSSILKQDIIYDHLLFL